MLENTRSTKFLHTSQNKMNLVMAMLQSPELRKWIYYLTANPSEEDDVNIGTVLKENIVLDKYDDRIQQVSKVLVYVDAVEGRFYHNKPSAEQWAISIAVPNEFWYIKEIGKLRAFELAHQIAIAIDDQRLAGIGKVLISKYETYNINQRWTQLTLFLTIVNSNLPNSTISGGNG